MTDRNASSAPDVDYVSTATWLRTTSRRDVVDVVADEFERRALPRRDDELVRWPRSSLGWRSQDRLHPRAMERRAAG